MVSALAAVSAAPRAVSPWVVALSCVDGVGMGDQIEERFAYEHKQNNSEHHSSGTIVAGRRV